MADKKKSTKASSKKKNSKPAVETTQKAEVAETNATVEEKAQKAQPAKQSKGKPATAEAKEKPAKTLKEKDAKENAGKKAAKAVKHFFKDLKSEIKKISWNSKEDTIKNTGVVLLVVVLIGAGIWIVDFGLTSLREVLFELSNSKAEEARIMLSIMMSGLM